MDPLFADKTMNLSCASNMATPRYVGLSPTEIAVKVPIAAFDDHGLQANITAGIIHAIARTFWPAEDVVWRNLIGCSCTAVLAVPDSEFHTLVNSMRYPFFGFWPDRLIDRRFRLSPTSLKGGKQSGRSASPGPNAVDDSRPIGGADTFGVWQGGSKPRGTGRGG